ncbi:magnesium transporter CorA family protein [Nonomuraea sp. MCN248]|uniref:Magnesium transporter CorA family protein n=1 Tax=Nonomuraea corallina TaxID=2989783 RepID=A0ABT4SGR2_9ACTN|nr:magnesium transporter CorA family protein [Nonomuraea corallina]MDA0636388.1 magnesium transporter CorA family protein [Nonomuraea corallina]
MRTRLYRDGRLEKENFPLAEISDHLADRRTTVWADLVRPAPAELAALGDALGLHELAVEDVLSDHQRPKIDIYDNHLFITVYAVRFDGGRFVPAEIDVFVTETALVTIRTDPGLDLDEVVRRWDGAPHLASNGVLFLLHGLLDWVVDGQLDLVLDLDARAEDLEEALFEERPSDAKLVQRRMYELRKVATRFRKIAMPMRELIGTLLHRDRGALHGSDMAPYYQDVYDHVLRTAELLESLRDLLANLRETRLAQQGFRLNQIMKRLTGWAAIIAVPTAITGFYGQNVPFPGSGEAWGFWASLVLVAATSVTLYAVFRKNDWL